MVCKNPTPSLPHSLLPSKKNYSQGKIFATGAAKFSRWNSPRWKRKKNRSTPSKNACSMSRQRAKRTRSRNLRSTKKEYGTLTGTCDFRSFKDSRCFLFLRKVKMHPALYRVHFFTFQTNRCVFLFWIMSRRANHFQSDRPIANPAECGTHDARPSFRSKRGLYFFLEAVRRLPVCERCRQEGQYQDGVS